MNLGQRWASPPINKAARRTNKMERMSDQSRCSAARGSRGCAIAVRQSSAGERVARRVNAVPTLASSTTTRNKTAIMLPLHPPVAVLTVTIYTGCAASAWNNQSELLAEVPQSGGEREESKC
ncbi:hypothetical protein C0Q70_13520 [Pomacea canaliculata]|uniref:Uncharacterized protein n=1 Tax=Pomacea canaliculata TaxID=400727 RepID=A0A2T7NXG3_POMCA|nr:hypothetical protein C0Q70_13520 [Pomacea canaliculata]